MFREKRILIVGVTSLVLLAGLFVVFNGQGQSNGQTPATTNEVPFGQAAKQIDDDAAPVVDLDNPSPTDRIDKNARKLKNARHDKSGPIKIDSYPNAREVRSDPEWRAGFSDLPADKSDVVVEATVGDSKAFLSEDRTGIYSEFTIVVSRILKVASGLTINPADRIVTERFGGKVRYPSGQVVRWFVPRQGVPIVGKTYLFFLAKADQDSYTLLTAYEIQGNRIFALDGSRTQSGRQGASIFDRHNGQDFENFMQEVERAINKFYSGGSNPLSTLPSPRICFSLSLSEWDSVL